MLAEEAEAAVIPYAGEEVLTSIPADTPQNLIIQLPVLPAMGNDQDRKHLAESFFLLFRTIKDLNLHSVVIPVFSGYDPSLFADIALSSVSAFLHRYPEYFIQLVFACRDDRELEALSASEGE